MAARISITTIHCIFSILVFVMIDLWLLQWKWHSQFLCGLLILITCSPSYPPWTRWLFISCEICIVLSVFLAAIIYCLYYVLQMSLLTWSLLRGLPVLLIDLSTCYLLLLVELCSTKVRVCYSFPFVRLSISLVVFVMILDKESLLSCWAHYCCLLSTDCPLAIEARVRLCYLVSLSLYFSRLNFLLSFVSSMFIILLFANLA